MLLKVSLVLTMLSLTAARGFADPAPSPITAPVLVELFTSEGCSSCPPADKVLAALSKQPIPDVQIIPLAWHIDYWDRLGWRDPFSSATATQRQYDYARRFGNRDRVYTPQMVVAGGEEFVGSDARRAESAIAKAAKSPRGTMELKASDEHDDVLNVSVSAKDLPATPAGERVQVLLVVSEDDLTSDVARGENAGRKLEHAAVVRTSQPLGDVAADRHDFAGTALIHLDPEWRREKLHLVAFAQSQSSGRVLAAGTIPAPRAGAK